MQSGARALQSLVGGSAEIGIGTFDHTIQMQAKGQPVVAVAQYGRYPGFVLGTIASKSITYEGPQSLKGLKVGVTSPGSSTHFMAAYMLVRSGLKVDDTSFVGTGVTSTAVAAARRGEIDAIVSSDPMISLMESDGLVKVVADTRTPQGTHAVYGGPYPGGVVYATPAFIERNPKHRAGGGHRVRSRTAMDVETLGAGDRQGDAGGVRARQPGRSMCVRWPRARRCTPPTDASFPGAVETAHQVLKVFDPAVAGASDRSREDPYGASLWRGQLAPN